MANTGYPIKVLNLVMRLLNCDGSLKPLDEGGCAFWLPGYESTQIDTGVLTESIAAIVGECYNRPASSRVGGSDAVANFGCGFQYPELEAALFVGQHISTGAGGSIHVSHDKPGSDDCGDCAKGESENCDPSWALMADVCKRDCKDEVLGKEFMLIRRISQLTQANRKRVGGGNVDAFGGDVTMTIGTNDKFAYGPGGLLISDNPALGEVECAAVSCGIPCPPELDLSELPCGCDTKFAGCKIDAAFVAANPEFNLPIFTM